MIDPDNISAPLVRNFIRLGRLAEQEGCGIGSTSEQIVAALINDHSYWLPSSYPEPLSAIKRVHAGGSDWWQTLLYVHGMGWREWPRRRVVPLVSNKSPTGRRPVADHWENRSRRAQDGACLRPLLPLRALRACRSKIGSKS